MEEVIVLWKSIAHTKVNHTSGILAQQNLAMIYHKRENHCSANNKLIYYQGVSRFVPPIGKLTMEQFWIT